MFYTLAYILIVYKIWEIILAPGPQIDQKMGSNDRGYN